MSPLHSGSLLDPSLHSSATLDLLSLSITRNFIDYIIRCTTDVVDYALTYPTTSRRPTRIRPDCRTRFAEFVSNVIRLSEVKIPVLLTALVYIQRAEPHLRIKIAEWACERVFLGALIVASKYTNDSSLRNAHWSLCTGIFGKMDIGRIEREFLDVLNWDLSITESEILDHYESIMSLYRRHPYPQKILPQPLPFEDSTYCGPRLVPLTSPGIATDAMEQQQQQHPSQIHIQEPYSRWNLQSPSSLIRVDTSYWSDSDSDESMSTASLSPRTPPSHLYSPHSPLHVKSPYEESSKRYYPSHLPSYNNSHYSHGTPHHQSHSSSSKSKHSSRPKQLVEDVLSFPLPCTHGSIRQHYPIRNYSNPVRQLALRALS